MAEVRKAWAVVGIDSSRYAGHSFRIGATTASQKGIEDSLTKTLGRWEAPSVEWCPLWSLNARDQRDRHGSHRDRTDLCHNGHSLCITTPLRRYVTCCKTTRGVQSLGWGEGEDLQGISHLCQNWVKVIKDPWRVGVAPTSLPNLYMYARQSGGLRVGRTFDEATPTLGLMATLVLDKVRGKQQEELQPIR